MADFAYNVVGTSHFKCQCTAGSKTWIAHWERATGNIRDKCRARGCRKFAQVGAHVKVFGWDQRTTWIIPFCQHHNKRPSTQWIQLKPSILAAAASSDCT